MRIIIYKTNGTVEHDAMIWSVTENDDTYFTKDIWGDIKKYEKANVALITVHN